MNTNNDYYFGFNHLQTTAHSGSNYFQFSSYYSASDYNQYLISPNLNLSSEGEEISLGSWHQYVRLVPANTKYIAIKYTAQNQYTTGIDDISFHEVSATPEIELTEIQAPLMAGNNTPFTLNGKVVNHSATPLTTFTVAYTVA